MIILEGFYLKTLFRNEKNGYTLFTVKLKKPLQNGERILKCKGVIPRYAPGMPLLIQGEEEIKEEQTIVKIISVNINVKTTELLKTFILSCLPAGLAVAAAEKITQVFINNNMTLEDFLQREDRYELLVAIEGISRAKANIIVAKMEATITNMELYRKFAPFGLTYKQTVSLCRMYGVRCEREISQNPYEAFRRVGVSFENADCYAKSIGIPYYDSRRIEGLVTLTYMGFPATGNCYMNLEEITNYFRETELRFSCYNNHVPDALFFIELVSNKLSYIEIKGGLRFYSKATWNAENIIAREMGRLQKNKENLISTKEIEDYINNTANHLDDEQKKSLYLLSDTAPCFIIGGPGTGKTTTVQEHVKFFQSKFPDKKVALCAPTGRAAERIKEATGFHATTIHMLLEYTNFGDSTGAARNANNPLETDFLIIDEFSLVGIFLFATLLQAIPTGTKVLIVGDWNQLPSIEPGFLLHDLIQSNCFRYTFLNKVHRQALENPILINSRLIAERKINTSELKQSLEFKILEFATSEDMKPILAGIYKQAIKSPHFVDNFHVITPMRGGDFGTEEINKYAQSLFHTNDEAHIENGDKMFFPGEKVITLRNNYEKEYYNGDIWTVDEYTECDSIYLGAKDSNAEVDWDEIDDIDLAYAMTIHKCQGSEGKTVVLVLPEYIHPRLITRSILFTAITRAKESLIILSAGNSLQRFLTAEMHQIRKSGICEKLSPYRN